MMMSLVRSPQSMKTSTPDCHCCHSRTEADYDAGQPPGSRARARLVGTGKSSSPRSEWCRLCDEICMCVDNVPRCTSPAHHGASLQSLSKAEINSRLVSANRGRSFRISGELA
ncbi:hypothetical protein MPTK1_2g04440 [Marchantia polymorpha subsp. ruderalis]|nr:hypothetical protein Mp_2g04440 [Marchantia polymorpha subsp. ruderalis]